MNAFFTFHSAALLKNRRSAFAGLRIENLNAE
jgi:hypothetical protein